MNTLKYPLLYVQHFSDARPSTMSASSKSNQNGLGSQESKMRSTTNTNHFFSLNSATQSVEPKSSRTAPSNNFSPTAPNYWTNPPASTVDMSRFFPGHPAGGPSAESVSHRQPSRGGQDYFANHETPRGQNFSAQSQGASTEQNSRSNNFATSDIRASQQRRPATIEDLEKRAPATNAPRRLQGTRPADTWVTGRSWRTSDAANSRSAYSHLEEQQSTLSPVASAFQTSSGNAMASRSRPAPSMPMGGSSSAVQGYGNPADQRQPDQCFRPMHQKLNPEARRQPLTSEELEFRRTHGISRNYQGEATNPQNISADIPDHENCGVWLTNLPPNCTYKDLLGALAQYQPGRVFSTYITPPDPASDQSLPSHRTSAAKVVFYRPPEAQRLLDACSLGRVKVQGYRAAARRNRIRTAAQPADRENTTRCLVVSGPRGVVDEARLRRAWEGYFSYETEEVVLRGERDGLRWLEWRFASHRAQAGSAFKFLKTEPGYQGVVAVKYGRDPCERVG